MQTRGVITYDDSDMYDLVMRTIGKLRSEFHSASPSAFAFNIFLKIPVHSTHELYIS